MTKALRNHRVCMDRYDAGHSKFNIRIARLKALRDATFPPLTEWETKYRRLVEEISTMRNYRTVGFDGDEYDYLRDLLTKGPNEGDELGADLYTEWKRFHFLVPMKVFVSFETLSSSISMGDVKYNCYDMDMVGTPEYKYDKDLEMCNTNFPIMTSKEYLDTPLSVLLNVDDECVFKFDAYEDAKAEGDAEGFIVRATQVFHNVIVLHKSRDLRDYREEKQQDKIK